MNTNDNNLLTPTKPKKTLITRLTDTVSEDVAIKELIDLVEIYQFIQIDEKKVKEDYPQALMAIKKGFLRIEDETAVYKLYDPKKGIEDEISFKTRITPLEQSNVTKGINVKEEQMSLALKMLSFLSGLTQGELNSLSKFDYKVIEQVSGIFF